MSIFSIEPSSQRPVVFCGEAMIELTEQSKTQFNAKVAGDVFNTAVYVSRLGAPTAMFSAVGSDSMSQRIVRACQEEKVATELLAIAPKRTVGIYAAEVDEHGERNFTYWRSESAIRTLMELSKTTGQFQKATTASVFYFSGITLAVLYEHGFDEFLSLLEQLNAQGATIIFDTNYRPVLWKDDETAKSAAEQVAPFLSVSLPTFDDERILYGLEAPAQSYEMWRDLGCADVCVKSGEKGAFIGRDGWVAPDSVIKPVDTTGAGDSFNAGYISGRLNGRPAHEAAALGNRVAAEVLGHRGAIVPQSEWHVR